jgi:hypothetical protein
MTGTPRQLKAYADLGFTFLGGGSDGGLLALAAKAAVGEMREL